MESKIIRYTVVKALEVENLIEAVNAKLEGGWELLGPPSTFGLYLTQTMINRDGRTPVTSIDQLPD